MNLSNEKTYKKTGLEKFANKYDVVISGSDQIWHTQNKFRGGFNSSFFLDFLKRKETKKVSYAPSFGQTKDLGLDKPLISKLIGQFDRISVRDSNSVRLIEQECDRTAIKVLDSTFLNDFSELKSTTKIDKEYTLLYSLKSYTTEQEEKIKSLIASILKLKDLLIVSLARPCKIADKNIIYLDSEEWVGYFKKASYVITSSYHETIFPIKFRRPFTVFTQPNNIKIKDLLKDLDLENRIIDHENTCLLVEQSEAINYVLVYTIIENKIEQSKQYLIEAIDTSKKAEDFSLK